MIRFLIVALAVHLLAPTSFAKVDPSGFHATQSRKVWQQDYIYNLVGRLCHPASVFSHCSEFRGSDCNREVRHHAENCLQNKIKPYRKKKLITWDQRQKVTKKVARCLSARLQPYKKLRTKTCLTYVEKLRQKYAKAN